MRKSNCLFSKLKSRILLALTVFALAFAVAGCDSPAGTGGTKQIPLVAAVEGMPDVFVDYWQDKIYGVCYDITKTSIIDVNMNCVFNVVSTETVQSQDGWTLVFCQCASGTQWTPKGYYFAVGVKASGNEILISCPLDSNEKFTSLEDLEGVYTSSYTIGYNMSSTCRKTQKGSEAIVLFDGTWSMSRCEFTSNLVSVSMIKSSGWEIEDSFVPTRDTSKETGNIVLYLYNPSERQIYGADLNYCAVKNEGGTYYVYWYLYDEDEDDNDATLEYMYEGMVTENDMPVVSADNLAKLKQMYQ